LKTKGFWISLSIFNLCIVALLGAILRSKILFSLPGIDYNHLLKIHSGFAFAAWVTLALMVLLVSDLLPESQSNKSVYKFLFWATFASSWGLVCTLPFAKYANLTTYISTLIIIISYVFTGVFIMHIRKAKVSKTTLLLSVASLIYLVLSSLGTFSLVYLFATKSLNAILYRDALFSYLHLQYNGFFSLAVFALLFHKLESKLHDRTKRNIHRFAVLLVVSIIPSMFLSYHWHDPSTVVHVMAYLGSILVLLSLGWLLMVIQPMIVAFKSVPFLLRFIGMLSIVSFMAKMFFQSFTIINVIGNPVFGDRPIIMGFLHLVFLGFVTLFLLSYFAQTGVLKIKYSITKIALLVFTFGIVINLALLFAQGVGAMFIKSSKLFPWFLWGAGIWLFVGGLLIVIARIVSRKA
jgi:hypothetical protein